MITPSDLDINIVSPFSLSVTSGARCCCKLQTFCNQTQQLQSKQLWIRVSNLELLPLSMFPSFLLVANCFAKETGKSYIFRGYLSRPLTWLSKKLLSTGCLEPNYSPADNHKQPPWLHNLLERSLTFMCYQCCFRSPSLKIVFTHLLPRWEREIVQSLHQAITLGTPFQDRRMLCGHLSSTMAATTQQSSKLVPGNVLFAANWQQGYGGI